MYILVRDPGRSFLGELEALGGISLDSDRISFNNGATSYVMQDEPQEVLEARFNDIVAALNSGKVIVYDRSKPVGYWKPKPSTHKKAEPKASPPAGK